MEVWFQFSETPGQIDRLEPVFELRIWAEQARADLNLDATFRGVQSSTVRTLRTS